MAVRHAHQTALANDPGADISSNAWNADHAGTNTHDHSTVDTGGTTLGPLTTHAAVTTAVHGIPNTANLYAAGGSDVAVTDGGTGASTAAAARTNLAAAPNSPDYLVATANAELAGGIAVGTAPGGELGGTWVAPTVDAVHSGSAHHAQSHNHSVAGDGTALNPASVNVTGQALMAGAVKLTGYIAPTISANTNDWAPAGIDTASVISLTVSGGPWNLTGIARTGQSDGDLLFLGVVGSGGGSTDLVLVHNALSVAANRIACPGSVNLTLRAGGGVILIYQGNRWKVMAP